MGTGYGTGWVYRVGNREGIPVPSHVARGDPPDSEAGPVSPCRGLEWVVRRVGRTRGRRAVPGPTLRARSVPAGPPWSWPCFPASQPIGARLHAISHKVSQNDEVSTKMS